MKTPTSTSSASIKLLASLAGLALLNGCALDSATHEEVDESEETYDLSSSNGNIVTKWATIAADAIARPVEESTALRQPAQSSMLMAQVQLAVYDTLVAVGDLARYIEFSYKAGYVGCVNRDAAVATAAYRVLRTRVPGRAAYLDQQYNATISAIPNSTAKTRAIELGEDIAQHYIQLRANDNIDNTYTWTAPTTGPGAFEPVVAAQPVDYKLVFVPPFTFDISDTSYFYPDPPPALSSQEYATDWAETRDLGRNTSTVRTEDQRQLALWMGENAFRWKARNEIGLALQKRLSPGGAARYFALAFTAGADTFQSGMSAKYHYNFWRPFHSVPRADTDGNDATTGDPTWAPLLNVNHPEYPAGHGFFGAGSMVEAARAFFQTDSVTWTLDTVGVAGLTQTTRTYTSLSALSRDIGEARILAGLHYRFSVKAGIEQGKAVVYYIKSNFFRRYW